MAYDDFALLANRMHRIIVNSSERIAKDCCRLFKGDTMLLEVRVRLPWVPDELHARELTSWSSIGMMCSAHSIEADTLT